MDRQELLSRLYDSYATTHAGNANSKANELAFRDYIKPHIPLAAGTRILDMGCGQGEIVRQFHLHGFPEARGVDISPEQVRLAHAGGVDGVTVGDYRAALRERVFDVVVATDLLEHLTREEVLSTADAVHQSLAPKGVFIVRTVNLGSPFGGFYRYGDLTHETSFTPQSLRQLSLAAGFSSIRVYPCLPPVHGVRSAARRFLWTGFSGMFKLALVAETGQTRGHITTQNLIAVMMK